MSRPPFKGPFRLFYLNMHAAKTLTFAGFLVVFAQACVSNSDPDPLDEQVLAADWQQHLSDPSEVDVPTRIVKLAEKPGSSAFLPPAPQIQNLIGEVDESVEGKAAELGEIPLEMNEKVQGWISYFTGRSKERFQRYLDRGAMYRELIETTLTEYEVPKELFYLALIESGFATQARSHAQAVGIWQFISGTGTRYGLSVANDTDERQDPRRSTAAAARYLRDLHRVFQDWYLAMAAYNAGEMRILGAIMRSNTRNFWELVDRKALPKETMNYIPKFIAAAIIGHHPEKFGFVVKSNWREPTPVVAVSIPKLIPVAKIAELSGTSEATVKRLNPHIRNQTSPQRSYEFWLPESAAALVGKNSARLAAYQVKPTFQARGGSYRVRNGDNLASIARRFGTSVRQIKTWNGLKSDRILVGKMLVVGPSAQAPSIAKSTLHIVKPGENLNLIAKKYGVELDELKRWNGLSSNRIYPRMSLKVGGVQQTKRYKVQRGDSLQRIAGKFKTSVSEIKRLNSLNNSRIFAGQVLHVADRG